MVEKIWPEKCVFPRRGKEVGNGVVTKRSGAEKIYLRVFDKNLGVQCNK